MSKVLDHCENAGRRHIRFRELAADVLGDVIFYFAIFQPFFVKARLHCVHLAFSFLILFFFILNFLYSGYAIFKH